MLIFPSLSTDAVAQYPIAVTQDAAVQVIRFIDGSGQRFTNQGKLLRKWKIQMAALNEEEIYAIEAFFIGLSGTYAKFAFPDPISGVLVPNCTLATAEFTSEYEGVDSISTLFYVRETNG